MHDGQDVIHSLHHTKTDNESQVFYTNFTFSEFMSNFMANAIGNSCKIKSHLQVCDASVSKPKPNWLSK